MKIRLLCFLFLFFCTKIFANEKELPIGTFHGIGFSLEKNGVSILSHKNFYYHDSNLKINKISSNIYELTTSVYSDYVDKNCRMSENFRILGKYSFVYLQKNTSEIILRMF